jgi:signal transduction histidine kinase
VPDAIGLPARWSGEPVGAVVAVGSSFSAGDLRVLLGLADAAAVLIGRARHEALAAGERDRAEALEAQAARAAELAAVREPLARAGQLAAAVAHEMSGPLACLASNLRTLSHAVGEGHGARGPADLAAAARDGLADLERLRDLVRCFRELARPGGGRAVHFDPAEAISDALRLFTASRPGCAVFVDAPRTLPTVHGPPSSVAHVLLNLLDNGADAGGDRGPLRLAVSVERGELLLRVRDAGPGIPPEIAARIFDPWFTTKAPGRGTGLGLWLCREIVEGLGGRIGVESGPEGTTSEVALPIESPDPEAWR